MCAEPNYDAGSLSRLMKVLWLRLRHRPLAKSLHKQSDARIDAELACAGLRRSDIFMAPTAIARHRSYLAHMLSAWSIDVPRAVDEHWEELKLADKTCAECSNKGRCRSWLQDDRRTSLASMFCPNAQSIAEFARGRHTASTGQRL
jgi:hypothetical protein